MFVVAAVVFCSRLLRLLSLPGRQYHTTSSPPSPTSAAAAAPLCPPLPPRRDTTPHGPPRVLLSSYSILQGFASAFGGKTIYEEFLRMCGVAGDKDKSADERKEARRRADDILEDVHKRMSERGGLVVCPAGICCRSCLMSGSPLAALRRQAVALFFGLSLVSFTLTGMLRFLPPRRDTTPRGPPLHLSSVHALLGSPP